ncbi:MAG: efflux RND transporter permease subunit, partial [Bacteroidetes bacterium]|nr:efflux RND transporter permease subunit [Bacteroidota bacterium]
VVVRTTESGSQVKIKDIARVELGVETYNAFTRLNDKQCAIIGLYQAPGSNAVELAGKVRETMARLAGSFPEGIEYDISLDATKPITAGIDEIVETLLIALFLVILVVYVFIQDWRATLIPTIAIPVSLVGTFLVFPILGFTINVLSLLGLVLAIGIVVDDAIVVVEAVQVNIQHGLSSKDATVKAMSEVTAPVIATTLVLVAVFLPVAAMGGITGKLYQQFAITIAVSVVFSSVNALTLSPALCSLLLRKQESQGGLLGKFFGKFNKAFDSSTESYMSLTSILTRKTMRGMIFIGILVVGILILGGLVPGGFMPEEDMGYFFVNIQLPNAASIQRADVVARDVEQIIAQFDEVEYVTTAVGFSMLSGSMISNDGFIFVSLKDWGERSLTAKELVNRLNRILYVSVKEAQVFAFGPPAIPGLG